MRKLDKTETLVTIGGMTYVRNVTKLTCIVVCVYISSLTQSADFLSLFEIVSLFLSNSMLSKYRFCATCVCLTRYSYALLPTLLFITFAYTDCTARQCWLIRPILV